MAKKRITVSGKRGTITPSNRKGKKWKFTPDNKSIKPVHAGAKGFTISPGTKKGDNYCARSSGIKSSGNSGVTPNNVARAMWKCNGKKSRK